MSTPQPPRATLATTQLFSPASIPEMYEQLLVGPLFSPWVDPLLDDVELRPGDRVLDVACGTGVVARGAAARLDDTESVVGVDVSPGMLAVARRVEPGIDWREGSASDLPLRAGEQFDVVVCQQGFQFFPDRHAAARQMRRALANGGRVGISTWRPDEEFPVLRQLREIAERRLGPIDDRRHSLSDPAPVETALREGGFRDVRSRRLTRTIRFPDGAVFVRMNAMALVGMSAGAGDLDEVARKQVVADIVADSADLIRANTDASGFSYELGTNVALARA
ncbi:MAG TPA: methyltransferase domain-containing protein [Longimicrobiaceae bacterium]